MKRYPRFSETFIVNEILAHEAAGQSVEIVSLYPPNDTHFQDAIARVRAPVTYLSADGLRAHDFWNQMQQSASRLPGFWSELEQARGAVAREVHQAARLAVLVGERGIRLLHAHFASTATEVARLAARFASVPYTFTAHAKDIFHSSAVEEDLQRKLAHADGVLTVSDYNLRHLQGRFGQVADKVERLYNGLHLGRFTFDNSDRVEPRIVSVGRLIEKKGFDVLIEACALLRQEALEFSCEIIGTGEKAEELQAQIERLNLAGHVRLMGPRPQAEIVECVRRGMVFAAPCVVGRDGNADGLPTVLIEAMALGVPCVSTDVTGIPELVRDGETGLMVPQQDAAQLSAALRRLLTQAGLRAQLAEAGRRLVERQFDINRNAAAQRAWFQRKCEQFDGRERARTPVLQRMAARA